MIDEKVPDILILDINMPVMGGIEVLTRIQTPVGELRCPTLVLTARSAMQGFFRGIAVDGFLAKPFSKEELIGIIRRILSAKEVETRSSKRKKRKLLIGGNDPQRTLQLQKVFTEAGYDLVVVRTGSAIMDRALVELPDAILLAENLPHMNGSVVASLMRTMPSTHSIPVVLYDETRRVGDAKSVWTVPEGVAALVGPSDPHRLLKAVEEALLL